MINKQIDLTLESVFAGDSDKSLLFLNHRKYNDLTSGRKRIIDSEVMFMGIIPESTLETLDKNSILQETNVSENYVYNIIGCYHDLFGKIPKPSKNLKHPDPYFYYHFCSGEECDRCGVELNFFNRGKYRELCEGCDSYEDGRKAAFTL